MNTMRAKIIALAQSQLGISEPVGDDKYIGRYNALTSSKLPLNVSWCACFVTWCADAAGMTDILPIHSWCDSGIAWFKQRNEWKSRTYQPQTGDIVYYDWNGDGVSDHVGIVESSTDINIIVIEGNYQDAVKKRTISRNSTSIMGYGTPAYEKKANVDTNTVPTKPLTNANVTKPVGDSWIAQLQSELNTQFHRGLIVDGIAGPKTLAACVTVKRGAKGNLTKLIQERYGFAPPQNDGIFGQRTEDHTKLIQKRNGLLVDGIVGPQVWKYLLRL